jgi:hypothetical protein
MTLTASLRVILCVFALTSVAAQQTPPIDIAQLGPQVGSRVPEFAGVDQFGRFQTLGSIAREEGAMLVFFRSADW